VPALSARADGPFEPNETAATAFGPVTQTVIEGAFETKQDVDWYLLHPKGVRQIGILAVLRSPCSGAYQRITADLWDADSGSRAWPMDSLRLGDGLDSQRLTANRTAFTSVRGHRYLLRVSQTGCEGAAYRLEVGPADALGTALERTDGCRTASAGVKRGRRKATTLKRAARRARGARRKRLRTRYFLQMQEIVVLEGQRDAACARQPLTGYPFD
jgi:hypothetical protein